MTSSLFSPSWYRVAGLKPRLRSHAEIHRHHYRGELWYVLQDHASGRFQRFTPVAYQIIGLMDGKRTVQEIWDTVRARLGEEAPTQEEVVRLLSQLHAVDALQSDVVPDTSELLKRFEKQRFGKWKQNLRSPLFMRFPLIDPERFLARYRWFARPFFSWAGMILWLTVVAWAVFQVGVHWPELTENITDRILAPRNLLILWLTYPFIKAFHEFGHAFAVKVKGGEVHEMGIMLLVFTPIPYVDASDASSFRERRERVIVGAAGMMVEVFIAALALFVWINIEPGPIRSLAYNVIFIAGVSSVLFNGNPLLRYDAYYILTDLLEIPNLGPQGIRYVLYLIQQYLFRAHDLDPPMTTRGEPFWFVVYTISSFCYRMFIFTAIILFVATKFFFIGVLFACWGLTNMFIWPAVKGIKFLVTSPRLRRRRVKAIMVTGIVLAGIAALFALVPVPLSTTTEGVIWIPDRSFVRVGTNGFVERLLAEPGSRVSRGDPLIECSDPLLPAQIEVLESKLHELEAVYDNQRISDRVQMEITKEEIRGVQAQLDDARQRAWELTVRSTSSGTFIVPMAQDLPGRFVERGELLGYVLDRSAITARVVVSQSDVDFVRQRTQRVQARFPGKIAVCLPALLRREVPAATDQLPGRALSREGGGGIAIDPRDRLGIKAFQKIFLFDLELPTYEGLYNVGGRVHVRFDHGKEPLAWRIYRGLRQLFLRRFNL
jgi:putative peptide zinc metalloprotease protein